MNIQDSLKGKLLAKNLKGISAQCLKITEKVSFNIASEASNIYILSGQKFIKNAKNNQFWHFRKPEDCGQTVLPDRALLIRQKLSETAKKYMFEKEGKNIFGAKIQISPFHYR